MEILQIVLQVLLGITSLLLTLLILLHKGRGGGVSDMFGGGMSSTLGSSGVAERNLNGTRFRGSVFCENRRGHCRQSHSGSNGCKP